MPARYNIALQGRGGFYKGQEKKHSIGMLYASITSVTTPTKYHEAFGSDKQSK